jgi:hypothetical protein
MDGSATHELLVDDELGALLDAHLEQQLAPAQKRGGRRAVPATLINVNRNRAVTFCKRRKGLTKKVFQLQCITHCNVFLLVQQVPGSRPVNNYAYACETWGTAYVSDVVNRLLSLATGTPKAGEPGQQHSSTGEGVEPAEYKLDNIADSESKTTLIEDPNSGSSDKFCSIKIGNVSRSRSMERSSHSSRQPSTTAEALNGSGSNNNNAHGADAAHQQQFDWATDMLLDEELARVLEEFPIIAELEEEERTKPHGQHDAPQDPSLLGKKRGPVSMRFIDDPKRCSTSFCKRKGGLMRKVRYIFFIRLIEQAISFNSSV